MPNLVFFYMKIVVLVQGKEIERYNQKTSLISFHYFYKTVVSSRTLIANTRTSLANTMIKVHMMLLTFNELREMALMGGG